MKQPGTFRLGTSPGCLTESSSASSRITASETRRSEVPHALGAREEFTGDAPRSGTEGVTRSQGRAPP